MIQKAAEFDGHVHAGALRKGSKLPYIVHPREVAMIVAMMTEDPEVIAAAYLHDVKHVPVEEAVVVCPVDPFVEQDYFEALKKLSDLAQTGKSGSRLRLTG